MVKARARILWVVLLALVALLPAHAQDTIPFDPAQPVILVPEIINTYPHDPSAYTQGLLWHNGRLYESSGGSATAGGAGVSTLRAVSLETGDVGLMVTDEVNFAEGLTLVDDRLIQITWRDGVALVYDVTTFAYLGEYTYEGEGWGICYDGRYLYMTDGTEFLSVRDAQTFDLIFDGLVTYRGTPINQLQVGGQPFQRLNEVECVGDYIYANVWLTDYIVQIDKSNGQIVAVIDATGLLTAAQREQVNPSREVLNGIAYNPDSDTFFITGKNWPWLFEVRFVLPAGADAPPPTDAAAG